MDEVTDFCDPLWVNTIIKVSDRAIIAREILNVFEDCQIILFLRNVTTITFFDGDKNVLEIAKTTANGVQNLLKNGAVISSWLIRSFTMPVGQGLSDKLKLLSDYECPEKLKDAKATKLTFAAQIKEKRLVAIERTVIYSYLPTKASKDFPFLINGDFLTNAERTELMTNIWNEFLFAAIAKLQLEWFHELQETEYRYDILRLLKGKYPNYSTNTAEIAYNEALEIASATIPFLPIQGSDELAAIRDSIIDQPLFSNMFNPDAIISHLGTRTPKQVIDIRVDNQSRISSLGAATFTFDDILRMIERGVFKEALDASRLIVYFYNSTINSQNTSWPPKLQVAQCIMDESGVFRSPKEIFIPSISNDGLVHTEFAELSYVHPLILQHMASRQPVMLWLQGLGVREPADIEIIRKAIFPMIANDQVDDSNIFNITKFIFKVYQARILNDEDFEHFKALKVATQNGFHTASQTYLSNEYGPERNLAQIIPNANFLRPDYIGLSDEVPALKTFFKRMGVREGITIDVIEDKIERQKFESIYPESQAYFTWLEQHDYYPSVFHPFRYSNQHYIQGFTAMEFRENLSQYEFSRFFWTKMLDAWDTFSTKCANSKYSRLKGTDNIPSFVEYYVRNFASIPCTDKQCYSSESVFAPSLKNIVGRHLPVADLPASMTVGQLDFFRFRKNITPVECLKLLTLISEEEVDADTNKQLFAIYDRLIGQQTDVVHSMKSKISNWRTNGLLLAVNNTFQPVESLYLYAVHNAPTPAGSDRFLKVPSRSKEEISALAAFFSIPIITYDLLEFVPVNTTEGNDLQKALLNRAPFLALIFSRKTAESYHKVFSRICAILESTSFINAECMSLVYKDQQEVIVDARIDSWAGSTGHFYFTGKWDSPITLYSLSNSLCNYLLIEGIEREFSLLMQLTSSDISCWLTDQGYSLDEISDSDTLFTNTTSDDMPEQVNTGADYAGIHVSFEEIFVPEVQVGDIDFNTVKAIVNMYSQATSATQKVYAPIESSQVKVDIGRWSEEYVYKYFNQNSDIFSEIIWHNKDTESYLPYDFTVNEKGVTKCIEVKGTPSLEKEMIILTVGEWQQMFTHGSSYSIFRIYGAGTTNNRLERNDNIRAEIESGKLLQFPIQVFLAGLYLKD